MDAAVLPSRASFLSQYGLTALESDAIALPPRHPSAASSIGGAGVCASEASLWQALRLLNPHGASADTQPGQAVHLWRALLAQVPDLGPGIHLPLGESSNMPLLTGRAASAAGQGARLSPPSGHWSGAPAHFTVLENKTRQVIPVRVLTSDRDLERAAELDEAAFAGAEGISRAALWSIAREHGVVLGIEDQQGNLMAQAQIVLKAMPDAKERLVRLLPEDTVYLEGFAVAPQAKGKNYGRAMILAMERFVHRYANARYAVCTVDPGNFRSLNALVKGRGFMVVAYDPSYYGSNEATDGRYIAVSDLDVDHGHNPIGAICMPFSEFPNVRRRASVVPLFDAGYALTRVQRTQPHLFDAYFTYLPDDRCRKRWFEFATATAS